MDYYLFIDESGSPNFDEIDPSFPVFTLCGTIMSANEYKLFDDRMIALKRKYWQTKDIVIHSSEIAFKQGSFQIFGDASLFGSFIRDMNQLIEDTNFNILSATIRKDKYKPSRIPNIYKVYGMSLEFIIERSIHYLRYVGCKKCLRIAAESRGKKEDTILQAEFNKLIQNGNQYWDAIEFQEFNPDIRFIKKNKNVNGLQLSDLCAYPIAKHILKVTHPSFPYIEPKLYCVDGNCGSYGLKVFPA